MRWLAGSVLALAIAQGGAASADAGAPQVSPLRRQREDAQRLREHQRGLEGERPAAPVPLPPPRRVVDDSGKRAARTTGAVLLFIAGASGVLALTLYATDSTGASDDRSFADDVKAPVAVTAAVTGVVGLGLVLANRSVQVTPTVTPNAVGFAITGRL